MSAPLYQLAAIPDKKPDDAHTGLWFDRFFNAYKGDWTLAAEAKSEWIKQVRGPVGRQIHLEHFVERQIALVSELNGSSQRYKTDWHFITGMGNSHPVENGFSWHPTLGVPYLAGSAVKGLVRAWVELNDDALSLVDKNARLKSWFGTEEKGDVAEQAGDIIFFDAIPDQRPSLVCDIMTPHMGDWYAEGGKGQPNNPKSLPADWHEPVPVSFLAVKHAQLIFSIAPRKAEQVDQLAAVFNALSQALEWLGAGAKTATGYGYMSEDKSFLREVQAQREADALIKEKNERLNKLSPIEKEIELLLEVNSSQVPQDYLINELRKGHWAHSEDQQVVACKVKVLLQDAGGWFPVPPTSKKNDKKHQRTLEVMGYLKTDEGA